MRFAHLSLALAALIAAPFVHAQAAPAAPDVSGRWEGSIKVPNGPIPIVLDIATDAKGTLGGTISQPLQGINGLPLLEILVEGRTVTIAARNDQPFVGLLADDGISISGTLRFHGYDIPMTLVRTGGAKIDPPIFSPAVDNRFEGKWNGAAGEAQVVLNITNRGDGAAIAELVNLSEGGLRMPVVKITAEGLHLTLDLKAVSGSYEGDLNADGTEVAGVYKQGQMQQPMTLRKSGN